MGYYILLQEKTLIPTYHIVVLEKVIFVDMEVGQSVNFVDDFSMLRRGTVLNMSHDVAVLKGHREKLKSQWTPLDLSVPKTKSQEVTSAECEESNPMEESWLSGSDESEISFYRSDEEVDEEAETVQFGPNRSSLPLDVYRSIDWNCYKAATRMLLLALFSKQTLATHSVTGKASPAHRSSARPQLDPKVMADIVKIVCLKCSGASARLVQTVASAKCSTEHKMLRKRAAAKGQPAAPKKLKVSAAQ